MADMNDVFADSQVTAADNSELASIGFLAAKAIDLQGEITAMEEMLKSRKEELRQIVEGTLPEAMDAVNHSEFKTSDGRQIKIKDEVHASISKDNAPQAHDWLRNHNFADIIKNEIKIPLAKGKDNVAAQILDDLRERFGIEASRTESVHASTLKAFCREQLEAGVELPAGLFGLFTRRIAVIK